MVGGPAIGSWGSGGPTLRGSRGWLAIELASRKYDEKPYCNHCYLQYFGPRGGARRPTSRSTLGASGSNVPVEKPSST
ncbi:uncharacterized protein LOC144495284 isoform X2 [Mustelus asterias]